MESTILAQQGTVSKRKWQFKEVGLVETDSKKMEVGRSRQRLLLNRETKSDESLAGLLDPVFISPHWATTVKEIIV